jgi:putative ABC transport system permease protein
MRPLENFARDLQHSMRQLTRSHGFSLIAVLTLALGIGANSAIFSIVEGVLLRPLPYQHPERLVVVWQTDAAHRDSGAFFNSYREFDAWRQHSRSFEKLAALTWATGPRTLLWQGKPIDVLTIPASVDFFSMLGQPAQIGRTFASSDFQAGCTVVLAYNFWSRKLGAPADIVGQNLSYRHTSCLVIGIMPKSFSFYPVATDAWSLITPTGEFAQKPWNSMTGVFGLLRPGVTRAAAESELTAIQNRVLPEAPPDLKMMRILAPDVLDLQSNFTWLAGRNLRKGLWLLLAASALILFMASLNVGSLLLSRSTARSREMAVRVAIGATSRRIVLQAFTESLALGFLGSVAGLALAGLLIQWFRAANPIELPPGAGLSIDWRVLLFTAGCGIVASIIFAIFPAWRGARVDPNTALKASAPSGAAASFRATSSLVTIQVALSMVLLAGAALVSESLFKLTSENLGYRTDHLFSARIDLPQDTYASPSARAQFADRLQSQLTAIPGLLSATLGSDYVPRGMNQLSVAGQPENQSSDVATQDIGASGFETLGIPLLRGRTFDTRDRKDSQPVAIVNQALARRYFPDADPLQHAIKLGPAGDAANPWLTIVGVVADVKTTTVFQEMGYVEQPALYRPLVQTSPPSLTLMIAISGSPVALAADVQLRLSALDANLVLSNIDGLRAEQAAALSQPRFRSVLLAGFAGLALTLALVGLYGLLSQSIARRTHDIGIRMALGADRVRVLRSILGQACALSIVGILIGAAVSAALIHFVQGMLYGVTAYGAVELSVAAAALFLVAILAAGRPAFRAASIDPLVALRNE